MVFNMEKVIFDTNSMRNTEPRNFLGNRKELEKFSKVADLIIPDIVIEEIKNQKVRNLSSKKSSFLSNPFHWMRELDEDTTKHFDIDAYISKLEENESLIYKVIELSDYSCLAEMKIMALKGLPPFEKDSKECNDKGFKDAYIYFTILEYIQTVDDKYVFVVSNDGRLKDAFEHNTNVFVVKSFEEFMKKSITSIFDDYFIAKLKEELEDETITNENISDYWISAKENQILLIDTSENNYIVEVDSGEIVSFKENYEYINKIEKLIASTDYGNTIDIVRRLKRFASYLSEESILRILTALVRNSQIRGTVGAGDYTIDFMGEIYDIAGSKLPIEIDEQIPEGIKIWEL